MIYILKTSRANTEQYLNILICKYDELREKDI